MIEGKRGLDTFASTNLDFILRSERITTIALGGFLTNCCLESTMRTGYEHGYQVLTLPDCMAATSLEQHDNAIAYDFPMFSQPITLGDFIGELGPRHVVNQGSGRGYPSCAWRRGPAPYGLLVTTPGCSAGTPSQEDRRP